MSDEERPQVGLAAFSAIDEGHAIVAIPSLAYAYFAIAAALAAAVEALEDTQAHAGRD